MTEQIGFVSLGQLGRLQRSGMGPKEAVERLLAEAKCRHPEAGAVVIEPRIGGFAFMAVRP